MKKSLMKAIMLSLISLFLPATTIFPLAMPQSPPTYQESSTPQTGYANASARESMASSSLKDLYKEEFLLGVAAPQYVLDTPKYSDLLMKHFNSLTMENEMKPGYILDEAASKADLARYKEGAALNFGTLQSALKYAKAHSLKMRGHTLIWHSQTPEWFFYEGYDISGQLASRDLMLKRMEHYIRDVISWTESNYPGQIYAWDVVNEAVADYFGEGAAPMRQEGSLWYQTIGEDFVEKAFAYARKYTKAYAPDRQISLIYNDYNERFPSKRAGIIALLKPIQEAGNIDGIGLQSHIDTQCPLEGVIGYMPAIRDFRDKLNMEIQVTELDIGIAQGDTYETQGAYYQSFMEALLKEKKDGAPITTVTLWGLSDGLSWRKGEDALLFDADLNEKPAFDGVVNAIGATASVIEQIRNIGTVEATDSCKEKIEGARRAYDSLTEAQKELVSNYGILAEAEKQYEELINQKPEDPPVIKKIPLSEAVVSSISTQSYTGKLLKPALTLTYNGKRLVQGKDYTISYSNNKDIGTGNVEVVGSGDYTGSITKAFQITVKKNAVYTVGNYKYKITNANTDGTGTVSLIGIKNASAKKNLAKAAIGPTVKIGGKSFKIKAVGASAFKGCPKLKSVTVGSNVETIGTAAFSSCPKLNSVVVGKRVKSIGQKAFYQCKNLKKVTIQSKALKSIGKNTLKNIHAKAQIKVPKSKKGAYQKLLKSKGQKKTVKIIFV